MFEMNNIKTNVGNDLSCSNNAGTIQTQNKFDRFSQMNSDSDLVTPQVTGFQHENLFANTFREEILKHQAPVFMRLNSDPFELQKQQNAIIEETSVDSNNNNNNNDTTRQQQPQQQQQQNDLLNGSSAPKKTLLKRLNSQKDSLDKCESYAKITTPPNDTFDENNVNNTSVNTNEITVLNNQYEMIIRPNIESTDDTVSLLQQASKSLITIQSPSPTSITNSHIFNANTILTDDTLMLTHIVNGLKQQNQSSSQQNGASGLHQTLMSLSNNQQQHQQINDILNNIKAEKRLYSQHLSTDSDNSLTSKSGSSITHIDDTISNTTNTNKHNPNGKRDKKRSIHNTNEVRKQQIRNSNREAARRCRERRRKYIETLEANIKGLEVQLHATQAENVTLKKEINDLRKMCVQHKDCTLTSATTIVTTASPSTTTTTATTPKTQSNGLHNGTFLAPTYMPQHLVFKLEMPVHQALSQQHHHQQQQQQHTILNNSSDLAHRVVDFVINGKPIENHQA